MTMGAALPMILAATPTGARLPGDRVPVTPEGIAEEAARCLAAGASMLHLHVRDADGRHSLDPGRYDDAIAAVRDAVGDRLVVQITTEAAGRFGPAEQMATVRAVRPEAVSIAWRELVPDAAPRPEVEAFFAELAESGVLVQFIAYSPSEVRALFAARPFSRLSVLFVLGAHGGRDARPDDLAPFVAAWVEGAGDDDAWMACAFGPAEAEVADKVARLGGHMRLGFENNTVMADGTEASNSAALVEQAARRVARRGRPLASADFVRETMIVGESWGVSPMTKAIGGG